MIKKRIDNFIKKMDKIFIQMDYVIISCLCGVFFGLIHIVS